MSDATKPPSHDLAQIFDQHMAAEFGTKSAEQALQTMTERPHILNAPTLAGGTGREEILAFYAHKFIPQMPADLQVTPLSRTVGTQTLVDEMLLTFTHSISMDWLLPGVKPTGRKVDMAMVVVAGFKDGKVDYEHVYWDQASVLVQVGLLDASRVPAFGAEIAQRLRATIS